MQPGDVPRQPGDVSQMSAIYDHAGALKRMGNDEELFHEMVGLLKSEWRHRSS